MFQKNIVVLLCLSLLLFATGCSKKVTKIVPEPTKPPVTSQKQPHISNNDSFDKQETDARIKELFIPIYFEFNRYSITNAEIYKLDKIGPFLSQNSHIKIQIEGHCDERGTSEYNMGLGENRARAVNNWLTSYGIAQSRIEITSFGEERPAFNNCDDESCHSRNRRVEWKILSK